MSISVMDVKLKCSCGAVQGVALNFTPKSGNRVICCCDDCQKFASHLEREADVLDNFGGTDIYQTSQSQIKIETGEEHIRCLRLTAKGLFRWYTGCCNTPIGNTLGSGFPFIGVIHNFISLDGSRDNVLGAVRAHVQTKYALGTPNYPSSSEKFPIGITLRIMRKMLVWKLRGMSKPSVFFADNGQPKVTPTILN